MGTIRTIEIRYVDNDYEKFRYLTAPVLSIDVGPESVMVEVEDPEPRYTGHLATVTGEGPDLVSAIRDAGRQLRERQ